jgi:hypothetical protein
MCICQDIVDSFKEIEFAKIKGQPTDEDLNQLTREFTEAAGCKHSNHKQRRTARTH